jgi:hypothetical protein
VSLPNPVFLEAAIVPFSTANPYRETAGRPCGARRLPGQDSKLDHQEKGLLRGTQILSNG